MDDLKHYSLRHESKTNWARDREPTNSDLATGALMRIADALEKKDNADGEYIHNRWVRITAQKFHKTFESLVKELREANKKPKYRTVRMFKIFGYIVEIKK